MKNLIDRIAPSVARFFLLNRHDVSLNDPEYGVQKVIYSKV